MRCADLLWPCSVPRRPDYIRPNCLYFPSGPLHNPDIQNSVESDPDNFPQSADLSTGEQSPLPRPIVETEAIAPVKVSFGYKIGLCAVALAMVLLPILYFCLIAVFGYGIYYHATVNQSILSWRLPGRLGLFKLLLYFGPLVIGSILLLFMFKPLFARRAEENIPYSLEHAEAPLLFQLIGQVCRAIGAPIPSRVDLDCSINAAASFRKGFGSFFSNDIMLTLGLPLVAGLTIQQFAGLLAHEFGHFAQ